MRDTPIGLQSVWLEIRVRRFRCRNEQCRQKTFAEQHPDLVGRRRRHTHRLMANLAQIGLATGGEAGVRLARDLAMHTSPATMIRLVRQLDTPVTTTPRIIGIDDWAFRKGRTYGTIIADHELGKPIDLLPSSAGDDVKAWLAQYPSIEIVTRDRSGEYRDAITQALPEATQIADRWHLLKNMTETIQRHISKRYKSLRQSMAKRAQEDVVDLNYRKWREAPSLCPSSSGRGNTHGAHPGTPGFVRCRESAPGTRGRIPRILRVNSISLEQLSAVGSIVRVYLLIPEVGSNGNA